MDKVMDSGSIDAGSIPVRDARKMGNFKVNKLGTPCFHILGRYG
jgi:hypothetical protein